MPSDIDAFKKSLEKLIKTQAVVIQDKPSFFPFDIAAVSSDPTTMDATMDATTIERIAKQVRNNLGVEIQSRNTNIIAVASRTATDSILRIPCRGGNAIGGYVHDTLNDCYCPRGVDYCILGYIPIALQLTMDEIWSTHVPIPELVMRRYMNRRQKNDLKAFKDHYKEHRIYFLQLVD